jgi:uncharacterized alkaline shock family protein YloU
MSPRDLAGAIVTLVVRNENGTITVPDSVLVQVAARAAEQVEGVRVRRKRSVDVEGRVVRLEVAAERGEPLAARGEQVQESVAGAFETMCGLEVTVEVVFEELL